MYTITKRMIMNKALDLTKLKASHKAGKLLKKNLSFPLMASIKYDGNYTVIKVKDGKPEFITSGGHIYTNNYKTIFEGAPGGVYIAERISGSGKLGDRKGCSLRGPKGSQVAYNHTYMVHDYMSHDEYEWGVTQLGYKDRLNVLEAMLPSGTVSSSLISSEEMLELYMDTTMSLGYEGLMLKQENWIWKNTKSRTVDMVKYKRRPTADLLVVDIEPGEGKYEGMIGSLVCIDLAGRTVSVGSGLDDWDRSQEEEHFIGKVVEVEYEQIMDTYIQPTYQRIRHDKTKEDIEND